MISIPMDCDFEIPKWDVALEALMREEYVNNDKKLTLADIERLAVKYAIRFDDMIITALTLLVENAWVYTDEQGEELRFSQNKLDKLYQGGRIAKKEVQHMSGYWMPQK